MKPNKNARIRMMILFAFGLAAGSGQWLWAQVPDPPTDCAARPCEGASSQVMSPSGIPPAPALAEGIERRRTGRLLWAGSVAAVVAASAFDAHSSWRKYETNPMLSGPEGQFGTRGIAIKTGLNSAWLVSQVLVLRKTRAHRPFAIVNFGLAAFFAVSACHNYGIARIR